MQRWPLACRIASTLVALSTAARASGDADLDGLLGETIITTASKGAERGSSAPATSTILTAEDIRTFGIHSIDEAINFLSLGAVTSNPLRSVDIGARGVLLPNDQGNHFLLLINGHAVNEALYGAARFDRGAGVPIELVDHIEVILGPGSVLYGSNAMLGVINVVTKRAREFGGAHAMVETEVLKSWRVAAGAGYEPKLWGTPAELAVQLEYYRQSGPAFGVGPQDVGYDWTTSTPLLYGPNGAAGGGWGGKASHSYYASVPSGMLTFKLKGLEVNVHASAYKRASPFNHLFAPIDSDFDDPNNYELDRSLWIDVKQRIDLSPIVQLNARLYGDTFDYQRFISNSARAACVYPGVATCRRATLGESRWGGLELQTSFDWLKDSSFVTLTGVDGRVRHVASLLDTYDANTGALTDSTSSYLRQNDAILGGYLQQTWQPMRTWSINGGGRLDLDPKYAARLSPRVAISAQLWRGGTAKAIYSEAFRTPSWHESDWSSTTQIVANRLQPESVRSVEALLDQSLGSHHLMFGVFRSWWSDLVELHVLNLDEINLAASRGQLLIDAYNATQYRNVASIDNYGFNAGYDGSLAEGRLRYAVNVTGSIARRNSSEEGSHPLGVAPQFFGNARLSYALPAGWPVVAIASQFVNTRPADRAFSGGFSPAPYAPANVELRGTVSGPLPGVRGLSYRLSVDYSFASRGAYVVGPTQDSRGVLQPSYLVPVDRHSSAELNPIDRFRSTIGLQYDFGGSSQ